MSSDWAQTVRELSKHPFATSQKEITDKQALQGRLQSMPSKLKQSSHSGGQLDDMLLEEVWGSSLLCD